MNNRISISAVLVLILISCKDTVKEKGGVQVKTDNTTLQKYQNEKNSVQSNVKTYTLEKLRNEEGITQTDNIVYRTEIDNEILLFQSTHNYGVLGHYNADGDDVSDYYIFPKPLKLENELKLRLKDTLFSVSHEQIDVDYSEVHSLLDKYIIIAIRGDASYPNYAIIDIDKKVVSGHFATRGSYRLSDDEKFLIGWVDSEINTSKDFVCPELKETDAYNNYVVTEEFKYELSTGRETKTGILGCGFVQ